MFDLGPAEIADVYKAFYAVLKFCKHTKGGDIANGCGLLASYRILLADILSRIDGELLQAKAHLAGLAVDAEDLCLNFVADLQEFLCAVKPGAP